MARPLRIEYPGAFYHIIQRGIEKKPIFKTDSDKKRFLSYFDNLPTRYHAYLHGYVLLDNHYHLILETLKANLSRVMHYLDTSYSVYFNTKQKRAGSLYQGRFKSILVQEDEYLHHLSRYIHLNPIRAKITERTEDYPWSSYKYYVTGKNPPKWLKTNFILNMFSKSSPRNRRLYRDFISSANGREKEIITENTLKGLILGTKDFFDDIQDKFLKGKADPEIPQLKEARSLTEPSLGYINRIVKDNLSTNQKAARKLSIYLSRKFTQNKLKDIASYHGGVTDAAVSRLYGRMEEKRSRDKELNKLLTSMEKMLKIET